MNLTAVATAEQTQEFLAEAQVDLLRLNWTLPGISGNETFLSFV